MKPSPAEKLEAFRRKLQAVREHGGTVTIHNRDGTDTVRHFRRLPDGTTEWTDADGNVLPPQAEGDAA